MGRLLWIFAFLVGLLGQSHADALKEAKDAWKSGRYDAALRLATPGTQGAAEIQFGVAMERGDFKAAKKAMAQMSGQAKVLAQNELYMAQGDYMKAVQLLEAQKKPGVRLSSALGEAYWQTGQRQKAAKQFRNVMSAYSGNKVNTDDAPGLTAVALAAQRRGRFQDANDLYRQATQADPYYYKANLLWGALFMEKYSAGNAETSYDEILGKNSNHPDAHAGMADVKLDQSYNISEATEHIRLALVTNKNHVPSLLIRAGIQIDRNDWDGAHKTLDRVAKINPNHPQAFGLRATIHWIKDEYNKYKSIRRKAMLVNKANAEFYHLIARSAVREHRYDKAIDLEKEALKVDPSFHQSMQAIGSGYLRLGEDKEGLSWLQKAWNGDQYNVRTFNLLNLFEETIPEQYVYVQEGQLRLRYHKEEVELMKRTVQPFLGAAFKDMVKRYKFTPDVPVTIELFKSHQDYSVRTVGLPNLGALGVCFGKVVTARSPTNSDMNWGMVLFHEMSHVFAIQMSKSRVPRWYTEGLSEYETMLKDASWRREGDAQLAQAFRDGSIPSILDLNHMFMSAKSSDIATAYFLSAVTVEYIAGTYGFDKVVGGLREYGKRKTTEDVITYISGLDIKTFDQRYKQYLKNRLAPYLKQFYLPNQGYDDPKEWQAKVKKAPKKADNHAGLALAWFYAGDAAKTLAAAKKALAIDQTNAIANYVTAEISRLKKELDKAQAGFEAMVRAGHDSSEIRGHLADIANKRGKTDEAIEHWCAAKALRPEWSVPYSELYDIYVAAGKNSLATAELEGYVQIEQMQPKPLLELVGRLKKAQKWAKVAKYADAAIMIAPGLADMHFAKGKGLAETGRYKQAIVSLESAVAMRPSLKQPAVAYEEIALAHEKLGDKVQAKAAAKRALAHNPDSRRAKLLLSRLGG